MAAPALIEPEEILEHFPGDPYEDPVGAVEYACRIAGERAAARPVPAPAAPAASVAIGDLERARKLLEQPDAEGVGNLFRLLCGEAERLRGLLGTVAKRGGATEQDLIVVERREAKLERELESSRKAQAALQAQADMLKAANEGAGKAGDGLRVVLEMERENLRRQKDRVEALEEEKRQLTSLLEGQADEELLRLRRQLEDRSVLLDNAVTSNQEKTRQLAEERSRVKALEAQLATGRVPPAEAAKLEVRLDAAKRIWRELRGTVTRLLPAVEELRDAVIGAALATKCPNVIGLRGELEKLAEALGGEP